MIPGLFNIQLPSNTLQAKIITSQTSVHHLWRIVTWLLEAYEKKNIYVRAACCKNSIPTLIQTIKKFHFLLNLFFIYSFVFVVLDSL